MLFTAESRLKAIEPADEGIIFKISLQLHLAEHSHYAIGGDAEGPITVKRP